MLLRSSKLGLPRPRKTEGPLWEVPALPRRYQDLFRKRKYKVFLFCRSFSPAAQGLRFRVLVWVLGFMLYGLRLQRPFLDRNRLCVCFVCGVVRV